MNAQNSLHPRASRHNRLSQPPAMHLTDRDKEVIKAVNDYRVMRQDQVQRLLFPSRNTAQVRLWKLWQHGFLKREFLPVIGGVQNSPVLYLIDRQGADLLQKQCGYHKATLRWSPDIPSHQFLMHTLGLSEIRLAAALSCREHDYMLGEWLDERAMKANYDRVHVGRKLESVLPDAYFVIGLPTGKVHFLLEFDRGPESLNIYKTKIATYLSYFTTDLPKKRYATDKIRVLTIVEGSQARLENLKAVTEKLGGNRRFWFSRLDRISNEDILTSPIWEVTGDSKLMPLIPPSLHRIRLTP